MNILENVCDLLPEEIAQQCHSEVESKLSLTLTFITGLMVRASYCEAVLRVYIQAALRHRCLRLLIINILIL